jgi:hypothetical protein
MGAALLKGPAELSGGPQAVEPADPATCLSRLIKTGCADLSVTKTDISGAEAT